MLVDVLVLAFDPGLPLELGLEDPEPLVVRGTETCVMLDEEATPEEDGITEDKILEEGEATGCDVAIDKDGIAEGKIPEEGEATGRDGATDEDKIAEGKISEEVEATGCGASIDEGETTEGTGVEDKEIRMGDIESAEDEGDGSATEEDAMVTGRTLYTGELEAPLPCF